MGTIVGHCLVFGPQRHLERGNDLVGRQPL
jgi:hypothetical protein